MSDYSHKNVIVCIVTLRNKLHAAYQLMFTNSHTYVKLPISVWMPTSIVMLFVVVT